MKFAIVIYSAPHDQGSFSAWQFCQAALKQQHQIIGVFFYQDGVYHAQTPVDFPQDEWNAIEAWRQLATQHQLPLNICIAAASRRGINEAKAPMQISGLGQWFAASREADRTLEF